MTLHTKYTLVIFRKAALSVRLIAPLLLASAAMATPTTDSGTISQLKVGANGAVSVSLSSGFTQANAANQCATATTFAAPDAAATDMAFIKSALLAAKSAGTSVDIAIDGCTPEGLLKIDSVWLN